MQQNSNFLTQVHPMRLVLYLFAVISILLRPDIGGELSFDGWAIVPSLLVPVLAPLFFMLLMLDALMTRVWLSEAEGEAANKLKTANRIDLVLGLLLLAFWVPFFVSLG